MADLHKFSLLDALRRRRSRRVGQGMSIPQGPLAYAAASPPAPLSEAEEAALAFAACGPTGGALADLAYGAGQGGSMLAGLASRTVASPDAIQTVSLVVVNDAAAYLLPRPQEMSLEQIAELTALGQGGDLLPLYHKWRIKLADGRAAPPLDPGYNFNINHWSLYAPGTTYFLPINEMTAIYINALLEAFSAEMGLFVLDERRWYQPAGIAAFARRKGGRLYDNPADGRVVTVQGLEMSLAEAIAVEQGMVLQNLGLAAAALDLAGYANYARHEYSWFQALDFRLVETSASQYGGARPWLSRLLGWLGQDVPYRYPVGLERDGRILLQPFCPPYYPDMAAAVRAFVAFKFGPEGVYGRRAALSGWPDPQRVTAEITPPDETAVAATIAYCDYIYRRYGRFPAYAAPFRTVIGYQAARPDAEFYRRFYDHS
jgi:hypothetical protein